MSCTKRQNLAYFSTEIKNLNSYDRYKMSSSTMILFIEISNDMVFRYTFSRFDYYTLISY